MIFHKINQFVFVSHSFDTLMHFNPLLERGLKSMGLKDIFEQRGFPILAMDETARESKHFAMEVQVGGRIAGQWWERAKPKDRRSWQMFVIACVDLEQFCSFMMYINHVLQTPDGSSTWTTMFLCLSVDIIAQDYQKPLPSQNDTAVQPSIQRLLEPLRRLHGIVAVLIGGPASKIYKESIRRSIMREAPTADEVITAACALETIGNNAFGRARFWSCVYAYEKAIKDIEGGHQPCDPFALVQEGKYSGSLVSNALDHLHFILHLDLVSALLRLREYHRAHNWTMVGLCSDGDAVSAAGVAQMWYFKAQASKGLGMIYQAHHELAQAVGHQPNRDDFAAEFGRLTIEALFERER